MIPKDPPINTLSKEELRAIEFYQKQRMANRQYYIQQMANPNNYGVHGPMHDEAIARVEANRSFASAMKFFRPSVQNFSWLAVVFIIPASLLFYGLKTSRENFEAKCRRGEISYRDRNNKFI